MESFMINVGNENKGLRIEPDKGIANRYKIYRPDDDDWTSNESIDIEEVPVDNLLGVITVNDAKDFTFDGQGELSGNDLLLIASEITKHPSFNKQTRF